MWFSMKKEPTLTAIEARCCFNTSEKHRSNDLIGDSHILCAEVVVVFICLLYYALNLN